LSIRPPPYTWPKDYEADADGNRFEVSIDKNVAQIFTADNLIVADASAHTSAAPIELVGLAPADLHTIGRIQNCQPEWQA
jgi:hypothetical protein